MSGNWVRFFEGFDVLCCLTGDLLADDEGQESENSECQACSYCSILITEELEDDTEDQGDGQDSTTGNSDDMGGPFSAFKVGDAGFVRNASGCTCITHCVQLLCLSVLP